MKTTLKEKEDHGKNQAKAQIASIVEMVAALDTENDEDRESAQETIQNDPLSVEVRESWHALGQNEIPNEIPAEFKILLCWGGPVVQIIGELSEHGQPENPQLQYQDWFTGWTDHPLTDEEQDALQTYCEQFYFRN